MSKGQAQSLADSLLADDCMQPLLIFKGKSANVIIQLSEETAKFIISGNICCFLLSEYDKELRKIRVQYEDSDQRITANS